MSSSDELYKQIILEHNKSPRNFREMEGATQHAAGFNPLCGDQFTVYLKVKDGAIEDISFTGAGCAISKSSASVMTTLLKGKSLVEAEAAFKKFHGMITSEPGTDLDTDGLGKMAVFAGVREFPVRIKCATLAWHTLLAAIDQKEKPVSTE